MNRGIGTPWAWIGFFVTVAALLALDLGVFHRRAREVSVKQAWLWSAIWVALSSCFGLAIAWLASPAKALAYASGYLLEKALAVDNMFVIALIFGYFEIPKRYQHRVLYWGILGALLTRGLFVGLGAALLARARIALYGFGVVLLVSGVRMLLSQRESKPEERKLFRFVRRLVPTTRGLRGSKFWVWGARGLRATPLVLALLTIEVSDAAFAVDSIPAVFAVTQDPFVVLTSNLFAVLGLRSLYFLLANVMGRFRYLKLGLSAVLCFVGVKLLIVDLLKIPVALSLLVIALCIAASMLLSWLVARHESRQPSAR